MLGVTAASNAWGHSCLLQAAAIPGAYSESVQAGVGFGLGFSVVIDPQESQQIASIGSFSWGGAASTSFICDPVEGPSHMGNHIRLTATPVAGLYCIFLTQFMFRNDFVLPITPMYRQVMYSCLDSSSTEETLMSMRMHTKL